jgi:MFS family permease
MELVASNDPTQLMLVYAFCSPFVVIAVVLVAMSQALDDKRRRSSRYSWLLLWTLVIAGVLVGWFYDHTLDDYIHTTQSWTNDWRLVKYLYLVAAISPATFIPLCVHVYHHPSSIERIERIRKKNMSRATD